MKIVYHPVFLEHKAPNHPENPGRFSLLDLESLDYVRPTYSERFLELAHTSDYINQVRDISKHLSENMGLAWLDQDTYVCPATFKAAVYAVSASILASEINGFALVRPPGHHASASRGSGFCIFNNMAIAAIYQAGQGNRVAILDLDAHHGNGTQDLVMGNENIIYFSVHQSPAYPGTGLESKQNCFNYPIPPGSGDEAFFRAWARFKPRLDKFDPDIIGISLGFDSYYKDYGMLTNLKYSLAPYKEVLELKRSYNLFCVLEGGYNPESIKDGFDLVLSY